MGSNRGKWGAFGDLDRNERSLHSTRCCRTPWALGYVHPKQTMTLLETSLKVNENRNILVMIRRRARRPLAGVWLLLGLVWSAGAGRAAHAGGVDSLVVLHTNDVHSHLDPFEDPGGATVGGVAARAALIGREKARGGRVLLLDGGDLVQGTPYYNRFRGEPDHKVLDLIGYDAIALGNHDLDDGAEAWRKRAAVTHTPILSANVFVREGEVTSGPGDAVPAD